MKEAKIELHNCDCMEYMAKCEDNQFSICITDPPYGIGASKDIRQGIKFKASATSRADYGDKEWDNETPNNMYFSELKRISKNQIIWGGNYYNVYLGSGRIFWDKVTAEKYTNSDGELAYQSFSKGLKSFKFMWNGMLQGNMKDKEKRIHPTQKPVALYKWLLNNYAKEGDTIFDSHFGSLSIGLACHDLGFDLTACELDKDYFKEASERLNNHKKQLMLI